ncbi:LuxR family transcriptional regulator [Nocardioides sp. 1609]|uniref:helix-turn-helix transcriptional regulator n=1 Tax=Nocardioides sp. 1609 TaxID=2508327 RepID=UPI00106FF961|nr:LuxR family transcriptional regulator [Nocardioides sp. 1609]
MNEFLDPRWTDAQVFLLEGAPGIGKTFRWRAAVDLAEASGARVLLAQPLQSEARLVGSSLIDLCLGITDLEVAEQPSAQADTLRAALLRDDGAYQAAPYAVRLAFTALLRRLAETRPLVIAVDDVQWLDPRTAETLVFAVRRLPRSVRVLLTRRVEAGVPAPPFLADLSSAESVVRLSAGPLVPSELTSVIRARLGDDVPAAVVRAAVAAADGNPLFGVEVARTLLDGDWDGRAPHVPLPESLVDLVGRHLTTLPADTRTALAAAAALGHPTIRQLETLGVVTDLDAAERAGVVRPRGHDVVFTHPLYAAAAYDALTSREQRDLHARLATIVEGPEERARHLALGSSGHDEQVAEALDGAAERALARGDVHAACDARRRAVEASAPGSARLVRRRVEVGHLLFRIGESDRAKQELRVAADEAEDADDRARALHVLARVVNDTEGPEGASELEHAALDCHPDDVQLEAEIHMGLAGSHTADWLVALEHADTAIALLQGRSDVDGRLLSSALLARAGAAFYAGAGADLESCRRALELEQGSLAEPVSDRAASVLAYLQLFVDDLAGARSGLHALRQQAIDEQDEASLCYFLTMLVSLETRAGAWDLADSYIAACQEVSRRTGNDLYSASLQSHRAWLAAYRGDLDAAASVAADTIRRGVEAAHGLLEQRGRGLAGFVALSRGDWDTAAAELDRYDELFGAHNAGEPALRALAGDRVEALVAAHRLDDAAAALTSLHPTALRLGRVATLASLARARALLEAELGHEEDAVRAVDESLSLYDLLERPFDRARALVTSGQVHRRFRRRGRARRDLDAAVVELERLGATVLADRARRERDRVGGRAVRAPVTQLTDGEEQVAGLVATGLTSAEVAATLFMSTKTVSAHLTRIYRKLGVRNRAELAAAMQAGEPGGWSPP